MFRYLFNSETGKIKNLEQLAIIFGHYNLAYIYLKKI